MTETQLEKGKKLALEIERLKQIRADLGRAQTISLGECNNPNGIESKPIILGKYVSDAVGESAVTFVTNHKDEAPEWAVTALRVARLIMCEALDADIEKAEKELADL